MRKRYCIGLKKGEGISWVKTTGQYVVFKTMAKDDKSGKSRYYAKKSLQMLQEGDEKKYVARNCTFSYIDYQD
jgi:hypothetical protein